MNKLRLRRELRAVFALLRLALHGRFIAFFQNIAPCFRQFVYIRKTLSGKRKNDKIEPYTLNLTITEKCSLKCRRCSDLFQYFTQPRNMPLEQIKRDIDGFFKLVDSVGAMNVYGGEPLMAEHLGEALLYLRENYRGRYKQLGIITNCTIVPSDELCEIFRRCLVRVSTSNYGKLSPKFAEVRRKMNKYGILSNTLTFAGEWVDKSRPRPKDAELADEAFRLCSSSMLPCLTLKNGKLYFCPFAANAETLGFLEPEDYSGLPLTASKDRAAEYIYRSKPLAACAYCGGTWEKISDGAAQC